MKYAIQFVLMLLAAATLAAPLPAQFVEQGAKLTASDATPGSYLGSSVAISADGNTAIVGGYPDNNFIGAAWVWTRSGGLAPGFVGLYQFDVVVPQVPDNLLTPLTFSLAGVPGSQTLYIAVQQGS